MTSSAQVDEAGDRCSLALIQQWHCLPWSLIEIIYEYSVFCDRESFAYGAFSLVSPSFRYWRAAIQELAGQKEKGSKKIFHIIANYCDFEQFERETDTRLHNLARLGWYDWVYREEKSLEALTSKTPFELFPIAERQGREDVPWILFHQAKSHYLSAPSLLERQEVEEAEAEEVEVEEVEVEKEMDLLFFCWGGKESSLTWAGYCCTLFKTLCGYRQAPIALLQLCYEALLQEVESDDVEKKDQARSRLESAEEFGLEDAMQLSTPETVAWILAQIHRRNPKWCLQLAQGRGAASLTNRNKNGEALASLLIEYGTDPVFGMREAIQSQVFYDRWDDVLWMLDVSLISPRNALEAILTVDEHRCHIDPDQVERLLTKHPVTILSSDFALLSESSRCLDELLTSRLQAQTPLSRWKEVESEMRCILNANPLFFSDQEEEEEEGEEGGEE